MRHWTLSPLRQRNERGRAEVTRRPYAPPAEADRLPPAPRDNAICACEDVKKESRFVSLLRHKLLGFMQLGWELCLQALGTCPAARALDKRNGHAGCLPGLFVLHYAINTTSATMATTRDGQSLWTQGETRPGLCLPDPGEVAKAKSQNP